MDIKLRRLLDEALTSKYIHSFVVNNNLTYEQIEENALVFISTYLKQKKCVGCKKISSCKQDITGTYQILTFDGNHVGIDTANCRHFNELQSNVIKTQMIKTYGTSIIDYSWDDIYKNENRKQALERIGNSIASPTNKGLFLYGPCGCGKTVMLNFAAKMYADKNLKIVFAYYPDWIRRVRSFYGTNNAEEMVEEFKTADVLFLDDFGIISLTNYLSDEILAPIFQARMEKKLKTYISSNLNYEQTVQYLSTIGDKFDIIRGTRAMERIKTLMEFVEVKDKSYRY